MLGVLFCGWQAQLPEMVEVADCFFGLQLLGFLFQVPSVPEELFFTADDRQERFMLDTVTSAQALVS